MIFGIDSTLVYIVMAVFYVTVLYKPKINVQYKYRSPFPRQFHERPPHQICSACAQQMLPAESERKMLSSADEEASNKIVVASTGCALTDQIFASAKGAGLNPYEEIGSPVPGSQEESF